MDYKISQLPLANSTSGTELLEIVQDNINKKIILSNVSQKKRIINKSDLSFDGNTVIGNIYKDDKNVCKNNKLVIKIDEEYKTFYIPQLNKINSTLYDSVNNLVHTRKIQHILIDENCVLKYGRDINNSTTFTSETDTQFWFHVDLAKMIYPNSIRDTGKILSLFPNISSWTKKEIGLNIAYPGLLTVHLDVSYFDGNIPTTLEELKQFFANNDNKKISAYYELATPIITKLNNEFIVTRDDVACTIIDNAYLGDKNISKSNDVYYNLEKLNVMEKLYTGEKTYYASEFGCSYSAVSGMCSGVKGENKITVVNLDSLDFEVGDGIAIENARYVRTTELSWLCALITDINYETNIITINRKLQENVDSVKIEHDNFMNYLKIAEFFMDKDYIDLKFEPGTYLCHSLRSTYDTLEKIIAETGIKYSGDNRVMMNLINKRYINIDFRGSIFKEVAKFYLRVDQNFGGNRCDVLPFSFMAIVGSDKVTLKNGTVIHDSETNCIYTGIRTGENMGIGFLVHGCKDVYLENLEVYGTESDGFALGGSNTNYYNDSPRGNLNLTIKNCRAYYCGRQGLTFSAGADGEIDLCDFSYTGFCKDGITKAWWGNANPGAGIDFEFESASDTTTGWVATSAIRRIVVRNSKLVGNSYALANGMTEGNFLMENSIIIGNPNGVFVIKTGANAGFTRRATEDEGSVYNFGEMQPISCTFRDCMIDAKGTPNKSTFGFFRNVLFDSCVLRDFYFDYSGNRFSIINSDLQYTDGKRSYMQGYPRFPLIQNCSVRFTQAHIDKFTEWTFPTVSGQFQDCTFFLSEPTTEFTDKTKKLLINFGKNSKRNYVYPATNYGFDSTTDRPIVKELTSDWGDRACYEVYSLTEFNVARIYRKDLTLVGNYTEYGDVPTNYIIDSTFVVYEDAYTKNTATFTFRGASINHKFTIRGDRPTTLLKIVFTLNSTVAFKFPDATTKYTYTIPTEYIGKNLILEMKPKLTDPLIVDIKIIPENPSVFS